MSLNPCSISTAIFHLFPQLSPLYPSIENHYKNPIKMFLSLLAHRSRRHKRHTALRRIKIKLPTSTTEGRARTRRTDTARANICASVFAVQTRYGLGTEREAAAGITFAVVLDIIEGVDCRRRLGGEGGDEGLADLRCNAVVCEEKG